MLCCMMALSAYGLRAALEAVADHRCVTAPLGQALPAGKTPPPPPVGAGILALSADALRRDPPSPTTNSSIFPCI